MANIVKRLSQDKPEILLTEQWEATWFNILKSYDLVSPRISKKALINWKRGLNTVRVDANAKRLSFDRIQVLNLLKPNESNQNMRR